MVLRRHDFLAAWTGLIGSITITLVTAMPTAGAAEAQSGTAIARVLPPVGIALPETTLVELRGNVERITRELAKLNEHQTLTADDRADVAVFAKALEFALDHQEFYDPKDTTKAHALVQEAERRLAALQKAPPAWRRATGLVVRGYQSSIDASVQPYGLVIPANHDFEKPSPLYVWLHGRGDKQTDLHFIHERMTRAGQIAPPGAIVLHPFGRHCVAFKFAGESDVLESIAHVSRNYRIDPARIVLIGFSMGGAGAWHLGAHYTERWVAVSPGAGFAETARYRNLTPAQFPPAFEQRLWGLYDVPGYTRNLFNLPVIAYSGEQDKQIQAARVMEEAFSAEGRTLEHLIGPGVGHKYEPETLKAILARLDQEVARGRPRSRTEIHLQTRTLRYAKLDWVTIEGLTEHWLDSRVDATASRDGSYQVTTKNVRRLRLHPRDDMRGAVIQIDGQKITIEQGFALEESVRAAVLAKSAGMWREVTSEEAGLWKRPGLQGPIDDAFSGPAPFYFVLPESPADATPLTTWVRNESSHAIARWRALMRGTPQQLDAARAESPAAPGHLIAWGDPTSNPLLAKLNGRLPVTWHGAEWEFRGQRYDARRYLPVFIYPNPLDPRHYLVVNSGLTFREGHDSTNSNQNPKLPDWAILDLQQPPDAQSAGKVVEAGFFDEQWRVRSNHQ